MANITLDFLHNYHTGERRESDPAYAYQYDEGHVLEAVLPSVVTTVELHYWIRGMEEAEAYTPTSITPNDDNSCTILGNIPNKYFETNGELRIYIVVNDASASITTYEGKLNICQRSKPDDYVDDDPDNEATRVLVEASAAAATATAAAQTAQDVADSIPADYTQLSDDVSSLKEDFSTLNDYVFAEKTYELSVPLEYYPIATSVGDVVTVRNKTGENFTANFGLIFYTEDKQASASYDVYTSMKERTFTIERDWSYIRPNYSLADVLEVTVKTGKGAKDQIDENTADIANMKPQIEALSGEIPQAVNLFDKSTVVEGKYINPATGGEASGWNCTDYIEIKKDVTYYVSVIAPSYSALYDSNKTFIGSLSSSATVINSGIGNLWSFVSPVDGYFRGTLYGLNYIDYVYFNPYANEFGIHEKADYSYVSDLNASEIDEKSIGAETNNLFSGNSFFATYNTNTGVMDFTPERVMTPMISISGAVFWFVNSDKSALVRYILQYNENDEFISAITTSGKSIGYAVLDANTAKIRINTGTFATKGEVLPQQYDKLLYVTDSFAKLGKFITNRKNTNQNTVSIDFFEHSVKFQHDYVAEAIEQYQKTINLSGYDFVMPMMTDIHNIDSEPYKMLTYMAESGVANICFNLGDNIPDHFDDGDMAIDFHDAVADWSRSPYAKCPQIVLRGNHDNNPVSGNDKDAMISNAEYYNLYHERTISGFAGVNKNYGYIDFKQPKIRVVFIDSGDIYAADGTPLTSGYNVSVGQDQVNWFINEALNFADKSDRSEWNVITCSHAQLKQLSETMFNNIMKAFLDGASTSGTFTQTFSDTGLTREITYNADFTQQGAMEYICHLNGHNHWDDAFIMGDTGRYDIDICSDINNGGKRVNGTTQKYTYTSGTINERCMDTLCLDKANKTIYMKRLGVGEDRSYQY